MFITQEKLEKYARKRIAYKLLRLSRYFSLLVPQLKCLRLFIETSIGMQILIFLLLIENRTHTALGTMFGNRPSSGGLG